MNEEKRFISQDNINKKEKEKHNWKQLVNGSKTLEDFLTEMKAIGFKQVSNVPIKKEKMEIRRTFVYRCSNISENQQCPHLYKVKAREFVPLELYYAYSHNHKYQESDKEYFNICKIKKEVKNNRILSPDDIWRNIIQEHPNKEGISGEEKEK